MIDRSSSASTLVGSSPTTIATRVVRGAEVGASATQTPFSSRTGVTSNREDRPSVTPFGIRLQELVGLEDDWDSYGALPPTGGALRVAWTLGSELIEQGLPTPQAVPGKDGSVQLEWDTAFGSLEIEILADPRLGVFTFDDHVTGVSTDGTLPEDVRTLTRCLMTIWRG